MSITDYLNRHSFIDFVCDIIENASKNKKVSLLQLMGTGVVEKALY